MVRKGGSREALLMTTDEASTAAVRVSLRGVRRELLAAFPPQRGFYFLDLGASAALGWSAFALAVALPSRHPGAWLAGLVAAAGLWRAGYFVHEVAHQKRALPGFELAWNLVVGLWIMIPSFMVDAHADHHRMKTYGTALDPEYEPVASYSRIQLVLNVLAMLLVGPALVLRFAVLGPLSWVIPRLRRLVLSRASALATNERYVNSEHLRDDVRVRIMEGAAGGLAWTVIGLVASGAIPGKALVVWYGVMSVAFTCNQARTLIAHAYEGNGKPMSLEEQVADSSTIEGPWWSTGIFNPVGTRYHALHHLAPSLPYHALPEAHRLLLARLSASHDSHRELTAYRATVHAGFAAGLRSLWISSRDLGSSGRIPPKDLPRGVSDGETIPSPRVDSPEALVGGVVTPTDDVLRARTKARESGNFSGARLSGR